MFIFIYQTYYEDMMIPKDLVFIFCLLNQADFVGFFSSRWRDVQVMTLSVIVVLSMVVDGQFGPRTSTEEVCDGKMAR